MKRFISYAEWFCFVVIISFITDLSLAQNSDKRLLTVDDLFKIKEVSSPRISPDENWVAYTVTETSLEENDSETRVWMKSTDGGEAIPMTMKGSSAGNPQWSPDGKYLSFTASRKDKKSQVWVLNRLGGEAQQLTDVEQGIDDYAWSPDGKKLALVIKEQPDIKKENRDKPRPHVINRLQFKRDYVGYLDTLKSHIFIYNIDEDSLRQLTSGDFNDDDPVWSPDGKQIAFVSNRTDNPDRNDNSDIWVIDANATNKRNAVQVTTNPGSDYSPAWSPDNKSLAYITIIEPEIIWYATGHLVVQSVRRGEPKILTKNLDRNVMNPVFSKDGDSIYFILEYSGERQLASIDRDGENFRRLISGEKVLWSYHMGSNGTFAALIDKLHAPPEVYLYRNRKMQQLTYSNREFLDSIRWPEIKNIHFKSGDGTEIEGFITLPVNYEKGKRYPTLLRIHGGPVSQYGFDFRFNSHLFASNGYVVLNVNPRGSSGYGQEFSHAIWADWGNKDYQDVMAAVDYAIAEGYADPDRLGVGGWSYGGILTNYVITKTDRFEAAITGASEVLYVANYGHDHYQFQWEKELGLPWENRDLWEKISPFNYIENITTPTLIMGGEKDWNVPILNSEQLYQSLRRIGKTETELVVYPGEYHGIRKLSFQKDRLERYLDWYGKYVK